jgi:hypothetical protein
LRSRELATFGERICIGGDMHEQHKSFLDWAERYDEGPSVERSRQLHEAWLADLECPLVRLDGGKPLRELCEEISAAMAF